MRRLALFVFALALLTLAALTLAQSDTVTNGGMKDTDGDSYPDNWIYSIESGTNPGDSVVCAGFNCRFQFTSAYVWRGIQQHFDLVNVVTVDTPMRLRFRAAGGVQGAPQLGINAVSVYVEIGGRLRFSKTMMFDSAAFNGWHNVDFVAPVGTSGYIISAAGNRTGMWWVTDVSLLPYVPLQPVPQPTNGTPFTINQ